MTTPTSRLADSEVGERLRLARESAKLTQAAAAKAINVARTTLVAIEKGQRRARMHELQQLASTYGTSANGLLRREAVLLDMAARFRKLPESKEHAVEDAVRLLNDLVRAEIELEDALGVTRSLNYPPERPILPGDVSAQAEQDSQDLRDWLGLGPGPVLDIVAILELHLGVRIYLRRLDGQISGLFAYDRTAGACMLLNANHPGPRLVQTAAHELGHLISAREQPEVLLEHEKSLSREERYAGVFSRCFLMPARAVRQRFSEITAGQTHLTRRHVILLAAAFCVSREAMTRRLEELGVARRGTWDWFVANGGITNEQAHQVLGELTERQPHISAAESVLPPRLALLAREAWKRGLYSEGQLSGLLQLDRYGMREVLDGVEAEEGEADDLLKLSR